jgi:hypothetical protein
MHNDALARYVGVRMQIKPATRGFSLFVILICALVICGCLSILVVSFTTDRPADPATVAIFCILVVLTGWMVNCIHICIQMYVQYPRFKIDVESGRLSVTNQNETITVKASDVEAYYLYNNKIRFVLREKAEFRDMLPFVKLRKGRLEISLNKLDGRIPAVTWLQRFDSDFNGKSKTNLGMIAQVLGSGLS